MKKLIWVVTIAGFCILACKKKDETPTPTVKKYEYKRTPGEVTKIEGDIYVDTGGTMFTVKGKGFDPKKKKHYHFMLMRSRGDEYNTTKFQEFLPGTTFSQDIKDTAQLIAINDSVIQYKVQTKNVYSSRNRQNGSRGQQIKDTLEVLFGVSSLDSTNPQNIMMRFDSLKTRKVKSKLFFNILSDTIYWYKTTLKFDPVITMDDVFAGSETDYVELYFNNTKLITGSKNYYYYWEFEYNEVRKGDGHFVFGNEFYDANKHLGLTDGKYTVSMKESKTGLPIEAKRGKNQVYLKFVN